MTIYVHRRQMPDKLYVGNRDQAFLVLTFYIADQAKGHKLQLITGLASPEPVHLLSRDPHSQHLNASYLLLNVSNYP